MNYRVRFQRLLHILTWKQAGSHSNNLACCGNSRQNERESDHSPPLSANATDSQSPCTRNKSFVNIPEEQNNSSEQKYYLCDYQYEGETWSIEIPADSWEDAEARLKRLAYGKVVGEIQMKFPVQLGWLARLWVWIGKAVKL